MKQINGEIIAVGTELLLGQIANTNAQWISSELADCGVNVFYHSVVGDNLARVTAAFSLAAERSDLIIVTGGLGPTEDDLTREAFQSLSGLDMEIHTPSMDYITTFFQSRGMDMTENNRRQARVFTGAEVIPNEVGMAPGMVVTYQGKTWIFLPGVPREMKQMMKQFVIPQIQTWIGGTVLIKSTVLRFAGIGEAKLEDVLKDLIDAQTNPTIAPLAQETGLIIRLTAKAESLQQAEQLLHDTKEKILERVGAYFYGSDEETLEHRVAGPLKAKNQTIAAAESLTGGMFTEQLISIPGAAMICKGGIISYAEDIKRDVLGVARETIESEGTISAACATEMASRVRELLQADIGIGFTGVAGPDTSEGQPVGTVYICVTNGTRHHVEKLLLQGGRNTIRKRAMIKGFEILMRYLED